MPPYEKQKTWMRRKTGAAAIPTHGNGHHQNRLKRITQACKEMKAEATVAGARQRKEEADQARAQADAAKEANKPAAEKADLNRKAEAAE